jgi:lysyl-tRNA synthetase class 2
MKSSKLNNEETSQVDLLKEDQVRLQHLEVIKTSGIDPYPASSERTHTLDVTKNSAEGTEVTVVGRFVARREMGKLTFCHLQDASGKMQFSLSENELGKDYCKFFNKNLDIGDFLQIYGEVFVTHAGEKTIRLKKYTLLTKTLLPPPEKWHGLQNTESRYRQRYLDLMSNDEAMKIAVVRSLLVREIRNYFDAKGFFEVETPILQPLYGGANARPFITHHHALDMDLYLRVAPELYLKRLLVGGFEKVYEIARCFRNEGIDHNHNPEFTQIEFYWAYADYNDSMNLMEDLLPKLIQKIGLPLKITTREGEVDFTPPYPRKTMRNLIKEFAKIDLEDFKTQPELYKKAVELGVEVESFEGRGKIIDEIYKKFARPFIKNPIFVTDHPVELSPLAKRKAENPEYTERFQLVCIGGNELCNAFSELNDPIDQEARFKEQEELRKAGDDEGMRYDEDFINALKHGMPPTTGLGMGIDRLVKLLLDTPNLKEVILFPTLRPEK